MTNPHAAAPSVTTTENDWVTTWGAVIGAMTNAQFHAMKTELAKLSNDCSAHDYNANAEAFHQAEEEAGWAAQQEAGELER